MGLFKTFCHVWKTITVNREPTVSPDSREFNADLRLAAIVPHARVVFLLRQLEGFSLSETAGIIGESEAKVDELARQAEDEIAQQLATKVLIIEDEALISLDLSRLVVGLGHQVCAVARTHREALAAIKREQPGLILADIRLADGSSGIDAVGDILRTCAPPVIFITAHPDLLLTGERPEPTFLISKPYDQETVRAMTSQVLFFQTSEADEEVATG
jgi:CheY-like chemotaxis protein